MYTELHMLIHKQNFINSEEFQSSTFVDDTMETMELGNNFELRYS